MKSIYYWLYFRFLYACSDSPTHRRGINYDEVFSKDTQRFRYFNGQFSHNIDLLGGKWAFSESRKELREIHGLFLYA